MTVGRVRVICCLAAVLAICAFVGRAVLAATVLHPPATPIPESMFGLHVHRASDADWPSIPFHEWRLWDSGVTWLNLEPKKGEWDFKELDKDVAMASQHNIQLLLTLGMTPAWAAIHPADGPPSRAGSVSMPKDINDWRNYVRTIATRYKGKINTYEIWNEPNGYDFFRGTPEDLVALAKEAYSILHEVDPAVTVVSPSPSGSGLPFLDKYLAAGGGKYADIIGFHFYVTPKGPEAMVDVIAQVRETMSKHGLSGKKLWNTETGYFIQSRVTEVKPSGPFVVLTSDEARAYVARAYILAWASGAERFYWYDWDTNTMGLGEDSGKARKSPADGYQRAEEWLVGAVMTSCSADASDTWDCEIKRSNDYGGHLVWNTHGNRTFPIPAAWNSRWEASLSKPGRNIAGAKETQIGGEPILLENKTYK